MECLETIFTVLTSTVVIGLLQALLINGISQIQKQSNAKSIEEIRKTHQESLKELDLKYQKEIEGHRITLNNYVRYSDEQFKLYNEFWSSLVDLKKRADDLWELADDTNLFDFAKQLRETREKVEKARLFIEESHYKQLNDIFNTFSKYSFGKTNLINLKRNRNSNIHNIFEEEINTLIRSNRRVKFEYDQLTEDIFNSIKNQIYFTGPISN